MSVPLCSLRSVLATVAVGLSAALAPFVPASAQSAAPRVEVFANSAMYLRNAEQATVYLLDGLVLLEAELSAGLPADEAGAMVAAQERLKRMAPAIKARGENAAQGLQQALAYGIDRIPAIVIEGESIVYGVTDVAQALALWRRQRQAEVKHVDTGKHRTAGQ